MKLFKIIESWNLRKYIPAWARWGAVDFLFGIFGVALALYSFVSGEVMLGVCTIALLVLPMFQLASLRTHNHDLDNKIQDLFEATGIFEEHMSTGDNLNLRIAANKRVAEFFMKESRQAKEQERFQ